MRVCVCVAEKRWCKRRKRNEGIYFHLIIENGIEWTGSKHFPIRRVRIIRDRYKSFKCFFSHLMTVKPDNAWRITPFALTNFTRIDQEKAFDVFVSFFFAFKFSSVSWWCRHRFADPFFNKRFVQICFCRSMSNDWISCSNKSSQQTKRMIDHVSWSSLTIDNHPC